jgi:hypothetical protein
VTQNSTHLYLCGQIWSSFTAGSRMMYVYFYVASVMQQNGNVPWANHFERHLSFCTLQIPNIGHVNGFTQFLAVNSGIISQYVSQIVSQCVSQIVSQCVTDSIVVCVTDSITACVTEVPLHFLSLIIYDNHIRVCCWVFARTKHSDINCEWTDVCCLPPLNTEVCSAQRN